jgi:hypothetical protein
MLHLPYNRIGDTGAVALAEGLAASQHLTVLNLRRLFALSRVDDNAIGATGAGALAEVLSKHPSITDLNLSRTGYPTT